MTARSSIAEIDARVVGSTVPRRFLELVAADPSLPLLHSMKDGGGWDVSTVGDVEASVVADRGRPTGTTAWRPATVCC